MSKSAFEKWWDKYNYFTDKEDGPALAIAKDAYVAGLRFALKQTQSISGRKFFDKIRNDRNEIKDEIKKVAAGK